MSLEYNVCRVDDRAAAEVFERLEDEPALDRILFGKVPLAELGEDSTSAINIEPGALAAFAFTESAVVGPPIAVLTDLSDLAGADPGLARWADAPAIRFDDIFGRIVLLRREALAAVAAAADGAPIAENALPNRPLEASDLLRYVAWVAAETEDALAFFEAGPPGLERVQPPRGVPVDALWAALREADALCYDGVRFLDGAPAQGSLPQRERDEQGATPALVWLDGWRRVEAFALADGTAWMTRVDPLTTRLRRWFTGERVDRFVPAQRGGSRPTVDAAIVAAEAWPPLVGTIRSS